MIAINSLPPLNLHPAQQESGSDVSQVSASFSEMLTNMTKDVHALEQEANRAMEQLHTGGEKNLHEAMISMEQADIALRYMVQVRNKALEAYQEISRLQV
ncbi:MAG: flagellar hook-basal body complex protein FliE [Desulfobulbus propionicus]|nr:MAG: flagellar hook-basal body complex protein FliE [Desulfobulbus propionicus]